MKKMMLLLFFMLSVPVVVGAEEYDFSSVEKISGDSNYIYYLNKTGEERLVVFPQGIANNRLYFSDTTLLLSSNVSNVYYLKVDGKWDSGKAYVDNVNASYSKTIRSSYDVYDSTKTNVVHPKYVVPVPLPEKPPVVVPPVEESEVEGFSGTVKHIFQGVWYLFDYELSFPEPIGKISPLTILMFFAIGGLLADSVSTISSRRD